MVRRRPAQKLVFRFALVVALALLASARAAEAGIPIGTRTVVLFNDHLVDSTEFKLGFPDACPLFHFHANVNNQVTALDTTVIADPLPATCGYGAIPPLRPWVVFISSAPDADFDGIPDSDELIGSTDPDLDGDGIPDGNEDSDGDGVTRGAEYWLWGTSDADPDNDNDGCDDGIEATLDRFWDRYTLIPVLVGIYANSGVVDTDVFEAIARANLVLRPLRTRLQVLAVNTGLTEGDDGSGGGVAGDANLTQAELQKVYYFAQEDVDALWGPRGLDFVHFAAGGILKGSTPSVGLDFRVAAFEPRASIDLDASTIVHQVGHIFGLADPLGGSAEDIPGNPMTPSDLQRDDFVLSNDPTQGLLNLKFTPRQHADIVGSGRTSFIGVSGLFFSPAAKEHYQVGGTTDELGDQTGGQPAYVDLDSIALASTEADDDIHVSIRLPDRFPASGAVDVAYRLLFDADANAGTGATVDGFAGIERELWLAVRGDASAGGLVVSGLVRDHADAARRYPLAGEPAILPVTQLGDATTKTEIHAGDRVEVRVRKDSLGLTATDVPTKAIASTPGGSLTSTVRDTATFVYHQDQWQDDPTLSVPVVYTEQNKSVAFTVTGLAPSSAYTLLLDDTTVKSGTLDVSGGVSSTFTVPSNALGGVGFLTALDGDGGFASAAVKVLALPFKDGFEWGNTNAWPVVVP